MTPSVTYGRVFNLGNYESERIEVTVPVPPDGTVDEAWAVARTMVQQEHERGKAVRQGAAPVMPTPPPVPPAAQDSDPESVVLTFGKYNGLSLGVVVQRDPDYVAWLSVKGLKADVRDAAALVLAEHDKRTRALVPDPTEVDGSDVPF